MSDEIIEKDYEDCADEIACVLCDFGIMPDSKIASVTALITPSLRKYFPKPGTGE